MYTAHVVFACEYDEVLLCPASYIVPTSGYNSRFLFSPIELAFIRTGCALLTKMYNLPHYCRPL